MKKFLTIILFFAAILMFGQDTYKPPKELAGLLDYNKQQINLAHGIQLPQTQKYNDFSKLDIKALATAAPSSVSENKEWIGSFDTLKFYQLDFSEEPFDGKI